MVINMEDVSWKRGNHWVLENINWQVREDENWAVLGLNGSGKTTLLNIVNGYIFPSAGNVSVLGQVFGKTDLRDLRKTIGWVSSSLQENLYINELALEIVLSGKFATIGLVDTPQRDDLEEGLRLLAHLGCSHLAKRPFGTLSQGEKQKVIIARSLISSPRLLILDEPCTGLDILAKDQLLNTVELLNKGKNRPNLIYVTHHIDEILPIFKKVLLLKNGKVHSQGKTREILSSKNLSDFFGVPVRVDWESERPHLTVIRNRSMEVAL